MAARLWLVAAPALLAPAVVFLLGPHTIFANNSGRIRGRFGELAAPRLLRTAAINWLILFGIGGVLALLSRAAARMYAAVLFAFGLLLWGQGNLWNADYGVLAGPRGRPGGARMARARTKLAALRRSLLLAAIFFRPDQPNRPVRLAGVPRRAG